MEPQPNFFDCLDSGIDSKEALRQAKDNEAKGQKLDYLIHKIFKQTEEGRELLDIWKEVLIMIPTAEEGMDNVGIGINEGMKRFIRGIYLTVNKVEKGER